MAYEDIPALRAAVEEAGDVLSVPAWEIRDAYGADRLGVVVRENISKALLSNGLGHVDEIPDRAHLMVRVYKLGTPAADVIEAVLSHTEQGDEAIRRVASVDSAKIIEQIRELVC